MLKRKLGENQDPGFGEKSAAWAVTNTMKVKQKLSIEISNRSGRFCKKVPFRKAVLANVTKMLKSTQVIT